VSKLVEQICIGCGTRRPMGHCTYPSNPAANEGPKRAALEPLAARRRARAHAITSRNRQPGVAGGMNGGSRKWWEAPRHD
jgi:hypothetical protein